MNATRRLLPLLVLTAGFGCGGSEESRIKLVPVSGTITLNGKPLADATVTFQPAQTNADSTPGVDVTGPAGNYKLSWKSRSGIAPGKYTVIVAPPLTVPGGAKMPEEFKNDPLMAQLAQGITPADEKKQAGWTKSEFEAEVTDEGGIFEYDVKGGAPSAKK